MACRPAGGSASAVGRRTVDRPFSNRYSAPAPGKFPTGVHPLIRNPPRPRRRPQQGIGDGSPCTDRRRRSADPRTPPVLPRRGGLRGGLRQHRRTGRGQPGRSRAGRPALRPGAAGHPPARQGRPDPHPRTARALGGGHHPYHRAQRRHRPHRRPGMRRRRLRDQAAEPARAGVAGEEPDPPRAPRPRPGHGNAWSTATAAKPCSPTASSSCSACSCATAATPSAATS